MCHQSFHICCGYLAGNFNFSAMQSLCRLSISLNAACTVNRSVFRICCKHHKCGLYYTAIKLFKIDISTPSKLQHSVTPELGSMFSELNGYYCDNFGLIIITIWPLLLLHNEERLIITTVQFLAFTSTNMFN